LNIISVFKIILISIFLSGCGSKYYMKPDASVEMENFVVPMLTAQKVTLVNTQSFNDNIVILSRAGDTGYANPKYFTDIAITITARELSKRGIEITNNSAKLLKISVDYIATDLGWNIESKVVMSVETGNGYTAKYTGIDSKTSWGPRGASDQYSTVLMRVVGAMLTDKKIIKYLSD